MPQAPAGFLGPLRFSEVSTLAVDLHSLYLRNRDPVAYLDESYRIGPDQSYYILSCATVYAEEIEPTRAALTTFYDGEAMHATEMFRRTEIASLQQGIRLAAGLHDGMDLIVTAPVAPADTTGNRARTACIELIAPLLQHEVGTRLFVFDQLARPADDLRDQAAFTRLRSAGHLDRDTRAVHVRPSDEPILGLPDLLAWAYRQEFARGAAAWFDPLRKDTRIHRVE